MVTVSFNDEWIQRDGGEGGEHERAGQGGGGGPRRFSGQDIRRGSGGSDFEGGGAGGVGISAKEEVDCRQDKKVGGWGKSNAAGTTDGSEISI